MNPEITCDNCGCPCHCNFEKHSTWGGPPSQLVENVIARYVNVDNPKMRNKYGNSSSIINVCKF